jgi:hypothetical protein
VPSAEEWARLKIKREENERSRAETEEQKAIQNNINSITYTDDPLMLMMEIDINTKPINIDKLIEKGRVLGVDYQKKRELKEHGGVPPRRYEFDPNPTDDDIINALKNAFVVKEQEKINEKYPVIYSHMAISTNEGRYQYQRKLSERTQKFSEHMKRKMPKIEAVLKQVKARLALDKNLLGIVSPAAPSQMHAHRYAMNRNNLSRLYASAQAATAVPEVLPAESLAAQVSGLSRAPNNHFDGLGGQRKRSRKNKRKTRKMRKN